MLADAGVGVVHMPTDQRAYNVLIILIQRVFDIDAAMRFEIRPLMIQRFQRIGFGGDRFQRHLRHIAAAFKGAVTIQHIGDAARHACCEIASGIAKHHDGAAGHIFAPVVANTLDNSDGAGIADGETFAGNAAEITFAAGGAEQHGVADNDIFLRHNIG